MSRRLSHRFLDTKTGEYIYGKDLLLEFIKETEGTEKYRWVRLYISELPELQAVVSSKAFDLMVYIYSHLNFFDNTFVASYEQIARESGMGIATVARIMDKFKKADVIRQKDVQSQWMLNPRYGFAGKKEKEAILEEKYWDLKSKSHFTRREETEGNK